MDFLGVCAGRLVVDRARDPLLSDARLARDQGRRTRCGGDAAELARMMETVNEHRQAAGRADEPFEVHAISLDAYSLEGLERLDAAGVTDVIVGFRDAYQPGPDTQTLDEKISMMEWYASEIIAKVR